MDDAKTALARIDEWRKRVRDAVAPGPASGKAESFAFAAEFLQQVDQALSHDLNINDALGHLFQLIRETNKALDAGQLSATQASELDTAWTKLDAVLGLGDATVTIPAEVQALADQRAAARKAKDFAKSDELRKAIEALDWKVKDTAKGQELLPG